MRVVILGVLALLLAGLPATEVRIAHAGEDDPSDEGSSQKPAEDLTEDERAAALHRADVMNDRVVELYRARRYREAEPVAREVLAIRLRHLGPNHRKVALGLANLAAQLREQGRYREALPLSERALAIWTKVREPTHPDVTSGMRSLAQLYRHLGEHERACVLRERLLEVEVERHGPNHADVAWALIHLAGVLVDMGKVTAAQARLEHALAINVRVLGPEHLGVARVLTDLAKIHERIREYEQAQDLFERALPIYEREAGLAHVYTARGLQNLAQLLQQRGMNREALPIIERAVQVYASALGPEHRDTESAELILAEVLTFLGRYERSGALYEKVRAAREKALGSSHISVAPALVGLGILHENGERNEKALRYFTRAHRAYEKALGPDHLFVARSLHGMGRAHLSASRPEDARPLLERALRIVESAPHPDPSTLASVLGDLASAAGDAGDYERAQQLFERAIARCERELRPDHPRASDVLSGLAVLLWIRGRHEQARPLFHRSLSIRERACGPDHPAVAMALMNLASVLAALGQHEQARPLERRAMRIYESALAADHPRLANALNGVAVRLFSSGQFDKARRLFERSLAILETVHGREHPEVARCLYNLAMALDGMGNHEEARPLLDISLEIREATLGPEHPDVALSLRQKASQLAASGEYGPARALFERALSIREGALGPNHPKVAAILRDLAGIHVALGDPQGASSLLQRGLDIVEGHLRRNLSALQPADRYSLARSLRTGLDAWLRAAPQLGRTGYEEVLRFKGLVARATAAERRLFRRDGAKAGELVRDFRTAERRLSELANSRPPLFEKERYEAWRAAYAEAGAKREALALAYARNAAAQRTGLERLDLRLEDVQARLSRQAVLLDFLRVGNRYVAWIVRSDEPVERIELGDAATIERAAARYTGEAAGPASADSLVEAGRSLGDLVLAPLLERVGTDARRLYICPDAALAVVPFAALPGAEPDRRLVDEYVLTNVSMAQRLVPWPVPPMPGEGAVLIGDVNYQAAAAARSGVIDLRPGRPEVVDRAPRGRTFIRLPATRGEVDSVAGRLGEDGVLLVGSDATEARFRFEAQGKRVLHFATHGFVREGLMRGLRRRAEGVSWLGSAMERQLAIGHDPMNLAGLALAGANARNGGHGDDGILTALEVSHLDLDGAQLVALSACQTALGTVESGEGVIGLVRGFQMAGAQQVIGSLWRVDDDATRALMVKFYELWVPKDGSKGLGAAEALRSAQEYVRTYERTVLDPEASTREGREVTRVERPWEHPYYWAAWVLWGLPN